VGRGEKGGQYDSSTLVQSARIALRAKGELKFGRRSGLLRGFVGTQVVQ
jgi:hypothetical protein